MIQTKSKDQYQVSVSVCFLCFLQSPTEWYGFLSSELNSKGTLIHVNFVK